MDYTGFSALRIQVADAVARVTLAHPPFNLLDATLIPELKRFFATVGEDRDIRVIVLESDDPDFFAAHVDVGYMLDAEGFMKLGEGDSGAPALNPMQHLMLTIRALPQVTIAKLSGRLRGGGNELATAMDMRFAAAGATWLSQVETRMGIIPGGGGTQLLPALIGRARGLEAVLTGDLYDAETAERYGWINRALPPRELDGFVDALARRIANLTQEQITAAKTAVNAATGTAPADLETGLTSEGQALALVYPAPDTVVDSARRALKEGAIQTRSSELDLENALDKIA